jgi:hypothetical protein
LEVEGDHPPALVSQVPADHSWQGLKEVEHIPGLVVDGMPAIEVEEVESQVVEVELHTVQSAREHPIVEGEKAQTPPAVEQPVRHIVSHSEDKMFDLPPTVCHNYGRYDSDYS